MTDARDKYNEALLGAIADGIWQGHRRKVHHYRHDWAPFVVEALLASGFHNLGPDDWRDLKTVVEIANRNEASPEGFRLARALQEKRT